MPDFNGVAKEDVRAAVEEWIDMEENPEVVLIELENEAEAEDLREERAERVAALAEAAGEMSDDGQAGPAPAEPEEEKVSTEDLKDVMGTIDALDHIFNGFRSLFPETSRSIERVRTEFRRERHAALGGANLRQLDIRNAFQPEPRITAADIFGSDGVKA